MTKQFWLVDSDSTQLTVAFMPAGGQKINKMTLQIGAGVHTNQTGGLGR